MKRIIVIIVAVVATSCYQPDPDELIQDMVVLTSYDNSADFNALATYAMPLDSIGLVSNSSSQKWITDEYASMITSAVRHNLSSTNRTRVDKSQGPQLAVNVF